MDDIDLILSEDEKDVLQELVNIAYGSATAVIAEMLDAFASLSIPKIEVLQTKELIAKFENLKIMSCFFSTQAFIGDFSGECAFFIDEKSANNLAKHLELEDKEDLNDAILELTNVLTSSLIARLAQEVGTHITYSPPNISKLLLNKISETPIFKNNSQIITVQTQLNFKDQKIHGEIFIFTKDGSIQWLKKKLNNILKSMM